MNLGDLQDGLGFRRHHTKNLWFIGQVLLSYLMRNHKKIRDIQSRKKNKSQYRLLLMISICSWINFRSLKFLSLKSEFDRLIELKDFEFVEWLKLNKNVWKESACNRVCRASSEISCHGSDFTSLKTWLIPLPKVSQLHSRDAIGFGERFAPSADIFKANGGSKAKRAMESRCQR